MEYQLLIDVTALIGLSIISALIGFAFNKMLEHGMIFENYKNLLLWFANAKHITIRYALFKITLKCHLKFLHNHLHLFSQMVPQRVYKIFQKITKPLGLCLVCNTTWIGFILSTLLHLPILYIVIVGISGAAVVILLENIFKRLQGEYIEHP